MKGVEQLPNTPFTNNGKRTQTCNSTCKVNNCVFIDNVVVKWVPKSTSALGKIHYHLKNKRNIKFLIKFVVYKAIICIIFLYRLESLMPYQSQINQLDAFLKKCLAPISRCTLEERISMSDLFFKCNIGSSGTFLIQSQLKWAGYVSWMRNNRISKIVFHKEFADKRQRSWKTISQVQVDVEVTTLMCRINKMNNTYPV